MTFNFHGFCTCHTNSYNWLVMFFMEVQYLYLSLKGIPGHKHVVKAGS